MYKISDKPHEVEAITLIPPYASIPEKFKEPSRWLNDWYHRLFNDMFFNGVKDLRLTPRVGVDYEKALFHVQVVMLSYALRHEHKQAACAYLFDQWFQGGEWKTNEKVYED